MAISKVALCSVITTLALAIAPPASAQLASTGSGQAYPFKPLRIIVPYASGAGPDFTAREIARSITEATGQPVVTDNRPGAAATLGHAMAAKAAPDGYTLLLGTLGGLVSGPALLGNKIPYDPLKDFAPIGLATYVPYCLFINAKLPANTVREFITLAKSQPGKLNYSSPGVGTPNHIGGAMLVTLAGIDLLHVPYKIGAQSISDLIAGTIQVSITGLLTTMPHVRTGRLKLLGCGHTQRLKWAPEVPMINETIPGYYNTGWWGLLAPAGASKSIVDKLNSIMNKWLQLPDTIQRFQTAGLEVATSTPQGYHDQIRSDLQMWRKLISDSKITVDSLP